MLFSVIDGSILNNMLVTQNSTLVKTTGVEGRSGVKLQ